MRQLEDQSVRSLARLGILEERVVGALVPQVLGDTPVLWPSQALGRVRIVRRERGVLFVTEGLSYPFDPTMHGPGREQLGFEIGIELGHADAVGSSEELSRAWVVPALLWLAACYVLDDFPLLDRIEQFGVVTQSLPPDPVLRISFWRTVASGLSLACLSRRPTHLGEPASGSSRTSMESKRGSWC